MCLRLPLHALYLFLGEAAGSSDGYFLLLTGAFILRPDTENAVSINIKGDLDLRHTSGCRQYAVKHEPPQCPVIRCHRSLPLEHMNLNAGLVISGGAEDLALGGRDGGIASDKGSSHSAQGLNAQGEGSNIQQQDILFGLPGKYAGLSGGANSDYLIRVDPLMRLFTEKFLYLLLDQWHSGLPADQDYLVNLGYCFLSVS